MSSLHCIADVGGIMRPTKSQSCGLSLFRQIRHASSPMCTQLMITKMQHYFGFMNRLQYLPSSTQVGPSDRASCQYKSLQPSADVSLQSSRVNDPFSTCAYYGHLHSVPIHVQPYSPLKHRHIAQCNINLIRLCKCNTEFLHQTLNSGKLECTQRPDSIGRINKLAPTHSDHQTWHECLYCRKSRPTAIGIQPQAQNTQSCHAPFYLHLRLIAPPSKFAPNSRNQSHIVA